MISWHLFETAIGWIGIAWSEHGLARLLLPEPRRETMERKLAAIGMEKTALPPPMRALADGIVRYAAGEPVEFADVSVDLGEADAFRRAVYDAARKLGFGSTTTYGALAAAAGYPGMARETGAALGSNPVPLVIPCHRILAAGNRIGGFSAPGGARTKERLLALEGIAVGPPPPAQAAFAF